MGDPNENRQNVILIFLHLFRHLLVRLPNQHGSFFLPHFWNQRSKLKRESVQDPTANSKEREEEFEGE